MPRATATTESRVLDGARDRPSTLPKMLDTEDTNGLRTLARYSTTHTNTRYRYCRGPSPGEVGWATLTKSVKKLGDDVS